MSGETLLTVAVAVIGSSGLFAFLQFLISRRDEKKKEEYTKSLDEVKTVLKENQLSTCRTELLIMMNHYPNETKEIYRLGQKYFRDLKGDFYMTALYAKWLEDHDMQKPVWFNEDL